MLPISAILSIREEKLRMQSIITVTTSCREELVDITSEVEKVVEESGSLSGIVSVYVLGATAALMIQENWDDSVQKDMVDLLRRLVPPGVWKHDLQDNNGDAHLKAGIIGPGEVIPLIDRKLGLSTWQNLFLCEFDGPRRERRVVITIIGEDHSQNRSIP